MCSVLFLFLDFIMRHDSKSHHGDSRFLEHLLATDLISRSPVSRAFRELRNIAVGHSDFKYLPSIAVCMPARARARLYVHACGTRAPARTLSYVPSSAHVCILSRILVRTRAGESSSLRGKPDDRLRSESKIS